MRRWRAVAVIAAAVAGSTLGLPATEARAHFTQSFFSYSDCGKGPTDPLNVAFFGRRASAGHVANVAERRLDWHGESGSNQSFKTHGRCVKQSGQRNLGFRDKHHLRFFKMRGRDRKKRQWVFSDAHRERKKFCGFKKPISDAVYPEIDGMSGFDKGAREVLDRFRDRRRDTLRIPNRRTFTQCTDEKVGFNGAVYVFSIK